MTVTSDFLIIGGGIAGLSAAARLVALRHAFRRRLGLGWIGVVVLGVNPTQRS